MYMEFIVIFSDDLIIFCVGIMWALLYLVHHPVQVLLEWRRIVLPHLRRLPRGVIMVREDRWLLSERRRATTNCSDLRGTQKLHFEEWKAIILKANCVMSHLLLVRLMFWIFIIFINTFEFSGYTGVPLKLKSGRYCGLYMYP